MGASITAHIRGKQIGGVWRVIARRRVDDGLGGGSKRGRNFKIKNHPSHNEFVFQNSVGRSHTNGLARF